MKASVFGENLITTIDKALQVGTRYSDEQYAQDGNIGAEARKKGFLPGEKISTILLNTALHQISYVLCGVFAEVLNSFDFQSETDIIDYLSSLNNMCAVDVNGTPHNFTDDDVTTIAKADEIVNFIDDGQKTDFIKKFTDSSGVTNKNANAIAELERTYNKILGGTL